MRGIGCSAVRRAARQPTTAGMGSDAVWYYLNGGLSIVLVLLGGMFAGLTLA